MFKNVNFMYYNKITKNIFFEINDRPQLIGLEEIYKTVFSMNGSFNINLINNLSSENILNSAHKLVYFGWKKEAIPITQSTQSLIARFFDVFFR